MAMEELGGVRKRLGRSWRRLRWARQRTGRQRARREQTRRRPLQRRRQRWRTGPEPSARRELICHPRLPWGNPADSERRPLSDQASPESDLMLASHDRGLATSRPTCAKFQKLSVVFPIALGAQGNFPMGAGMRSLLWNVYRDDMTQRTTQTPCEFSSFCAICDFLRSGRG